jgi:4-hydroxy-2-oxoheptanedioate aldolase
MSNELKRKLRQGRTVVGTWCMLPSPAVVDVVASSGLDFVVVDMEHGAMSFERAEEMVRAAEANGCQAVVRVDRNEAPVVLHALEIGSRAVLVPHVSSAPEARRVADAALYPPRGDRGLSPYTRVHGYTHEGLPDSLRAADEDTLVGILVEGAEGMRRLPEICRVPGVDLVYLGVYDLSQSIGLPGQLDHPKVLSAIEKCARLAAKAGKVCGTFSRSVKMSKVYADCGVRFIAHGADCLALKSAYRDLAAQYRASLGGASRAARAAGRGR